MAFPPGFRMLAGTPGLRSFTNTLEQRAINYACLGRPGPETNELPNYNCPNGLRAQVFFPSCWDGVNLDSPDHKSHMAYPDRVDSGRCPPSHPKRFISLFYEVTWDTNEFRDQWYGGKQPFVFSNGDETGYGYHGDFVNGWDVDVLQRAVTECTNNSGNIEDCSHLDLFTDEFTNGCKIPTSIDEQVFGTMSALPGCNPSTGLGPNAVMSTGCGAPTTFSPPENPFVDLTASEGFRYIGCGKDNIGGRTLTGARTSSPSMTNEMCVEFCKARGFSIAGTEYSNECYCGNSIPAAAAPIDGLMGDCFMKCAGDDTENCGGAGTISLYQRCASAATCINVSYGVNNGTSTAPKPAPVVVPAPSVAPAPVSTPKASSTPVRIPGTAPGTAPVRPKPAPEPLPAPLPAPIVKTPEVEEEEETVDNSAPVTPVIPPTEPKVDSPAPVVAPPAGGAAPTKAVCGRAHTVTIAETTVRVTVTAAPAAATPAVVNNERPAGPVAGFPGKGAPSTGSDDVEEEDNSPVGGDTPAVEPEAPIIVPVPGGPYGNSTGLHGGKAKGPKKHGHGHGRFGPRPTGGY